jgi:hypothetical protein
MLRHILEELLISSVPHFFIAKIEVYYDDPFISDDGGPPCEAAFLSSEPTNTSTVAVLTNENNISPVCRQPIPN